MKHHPEIILAKTCLPVFIIFSLLMLSACQQAQLPELTPSPAIAENTPVIEETPQVQITPSQPAVTTLSTQPYKSPSGAYEIFFPKDWNCSESGQYRVDCQAPDGKANITLRATATGYELTQPAFEALVNAEVVYTYSGKKVYSEISRETGEGLISINADWRNGDIPWQSEDIFTRSGAGAYQLSLSAEKTQWEQYTALFDEVNAKVAFYPETLSSVPIYAQTRKYSAPDVLFTLEVPVSWSGYADVASIENTQLEGFLSPDMHAAVQVAVYRQGSLIKREAKAFKTLEIMRKLYGYDLHVSHDKALPDGRERLAWSAEKRQVSGISYFDSFGGSMYIFSVVWDNAFQDMYMPTLDAVVNSFGHE
jgi:hypothetical protein